MANLFTKKFNFNSKDIKESYINIKDLILFEKELGYGFVTEDIKEKDELLQFAELNSALDRKSVV